MEKILELLRSVTDETSIEEARRIILDVVELCDAIVNDINGYVDAIAQLTEERAKQDAEIARLREENGRIYRERAEQIRDNIERKADEVVDNAAELSEDELLANIDI